ncbi:hypothetical protein vBSlqSZDD2_08 [Serratia phage vB_SlqS_ZDD2]|nr:hypothetical protein vBSlqSZDD2_08 [Serratia phage vB_SlqS_ZDD2]
MAINYGRMRGTATRLLTENGKQFDAYRNGRVEIGDDGDEVLVPPVAYKITGVCADYKAYEIDGKLILSGDKKLIVTSEEVIAIGDIVTTDDGQYRILNPGDKNPAGVNLVYVAQARRVNGG